MKKTFSDYEKDVVKYKPEIENDLQQESTKRRAFQKIFYLIPSYLKPVERIKSVLKCLTSNPESIVEYITVDPEKIKSLLSNQQPFPTFDLIVITCVLIFDTDKTQDHLFQIFCYCINIYEYLKEMDPQEKVYLNDSNKDDCSYTVGEAMTVINRRLCFLIELLITTYHDSTPKQFITHFLESPLIQSLNLHYNDQTLSVIGRVLLLNGEIEESEEYFNSVQNVELKTMNKGIKLLFECKFVDAKNCFEEINDPIAKAYQAVCLVYIGQIEEAYKIMVNLKREELGNEIKISLWASFNDFFAYICNITGKQYENVNDEEYFPITKKIK